MADGKDFGFAEKYYELTDEMRKFEGRALHRVKYADGELGGWIESERNLFLGARVLDDSIVCGRARVGGEGTEIRDGAVVCGFASVGKGSIVCGSSWIGDHAEVGDGCEIHDSMVSGHAKVQCGSSLINSKVCDDGDVCGSLEDSSVSGDAVVFGGRLDCCDVSGLASVSGGNLYNCNLSGEAVVAQAVDGVGDDRIPDLWDCNLSGKARVEGEGIEIAYCDLDGSSEVSGNVKFLGERVGTRERHSHLGGNAKLGGDAKVRGIVDLTDGEHLGGEIVGEMLEQIA